MTPSFPRDLLYHGSTERVERVDVRLGARGKDFGRGFYTTTLAGQATKFARLKSKRSGLAAGVVSVYRLLSVEGLSVKAFPGSDAAWFDFVLSRRGFADLTAGRDDVVYDVVVGPVADDAVGVVLNQFVAGAYGEPSMAEAKDTAIRLLLSQRLHDQVFFGTARAAERLDFVEAFDVRLD